MMYNDVTIFPQAIDELAEWDGQCPPTAKHQRGKVITPKLKAVIGKVGMIQRSQTLLDSF